MGYVRVFAPDAKSQWQALEVQSQEVAPAAGGARPTKGYAMPRAAAGAAVRRRAALISSNTTAAGSKDRSRAARS